MRAVLMFWFSSSSSTKRSSSKTVPLFPQSVLLSECSRLKSQSPRMPFRGSWGGEELPSLNWV
jgi:hypothetical protein